MCVDEKKELTMPHMNIIDTRDKNHRDMVVGESCTAIIDGHPYKAKILAARVGGCVVRVESGHNHLIPWSQIRYITRTY